MQNTRNTNDSFWIVLVIGIIVIVWLRWPEEYKYANEYRVNYAQVSIGRQPHNCEWLSSPLGDKNCHYERMIIAYNIENQPVAGTDIQIRTTESHTQIISYDGGKSWQESSLTDLKPVQVVVSWRKVDD